MAENLEVLLGDCRAVLPTLEAESVQCCVTSPPYWGLRDYGTAQWDGGEVGCEHKADIGARASSGLNGSLAYKDGRVFSPYRGVCGKCGARRIDSQLGLEATPEEYIANMVAVFREVWRVLRPDGTLWLNLGDSYVSNPATANAKNGFESFRGSDTPTLNREYQGRNSYRGNGLKPKDLCMMPARVALALQADGWWVRSTIIWHKPNPMPESVTDRPTKAHEYIFLLTKAERYYYDNEAIREPNQNNGATDSGYLMDWSLRPNNGATDGKGLGGYRMGSVENGRNKRTVWTIATQPYAEAHFATFPEEIPKLCILAGSRPGDTVLDPFAGSGTVGKVALELGRRAVLIELNPDYIELAQDRTLVTPGFF